MRTWIGPLAFWLISCGSSTTEKTTSGPGTAAVAENSAWLDFAPQASTDGQRLAFLSLRDAGAFRVYLYDEGAEPRLAPLAQALPLEPGTNELATSLSADGNRLLAWRSGPEKNEILLSSFDRTQHTALPLDQDARLRELTFAPSGQNYFAYTSRQAGADAVHIVAFTPGSPVAMVEEAVLNGEYGAQFAVNGSDIYVFTRKLSASGQVTVQHHKRSAGTWTAAADSVSLSASDAAVPSAASALGLFYAQSPDTVRLKAKLGTFVTDAESYQRNVGVTQETMQFPGFSASSVNFSAEDYRRNQPLTLGALSATADGAYVLISGFDAWFCKSRSVAHSLLLLVRTSDGATLPLIPTRDNGTEAWTGLASEPCSYLDQTPIPKLQEFDSTVANGQILSVSGGRVTMIFESKYTGDREIRRLSFDVSDWAAKTYANPVFTEISANHR